LVAGEKRLANFFFLKKLVNRQPACVAWDYFITATKTPRKTHKTTVLQQQIQKLSQCNAVALLMFNVFLSLAKKFSITTSLFAGVDGATVFRFPTNTTQ